MSKELIEKVGYAVNNAMCAWAANNSKLGAGRWDVPDDVIARAAILAVLEHFSEPGNISMEMVNGYVDGIDQTSIFQEGIAAAVRAARDEVSRG